MCDEHWWTRGCACASLCLAVWLRQCKMMWNGPLCHATVTTFLFSIAYILYSSGQAPYLVHLRMYSSTWILYDVTSPWPKTLSFPLGITGVQESDGICMTSSSQICRVMSSDVAGILLGPVRSLFLSNAFARFSATWSNLQGESLITFQELHIPEDIQKHYFHVLEPSFLCRVDVSLILIPSNWMVQGHKAARASHPLCRFRISSSIRLKHRQWNEAEVVSATPCHCPPQMALVCTNIYNYII